MLTIKMENNVIQYFINRHEIGINVLNPDLILPYLRSPLFRRQHLLGKSL